MTHHNTDPREIAKFDQLAAGWWDPQGEFKTLHDINPLRLDYIDERAGLVGKRVVDVGCGGGILAESMARRGASVTGVDMAEAALEAARQHGRDNDVPVDYRCQTAEDLAQAEPAGFDVVTCMELLEHVPDPASLIQACGRLVKPGGQVFFSTLNRNPKAYLFVVLGAEYLLRMMPKGTHDYSKFIRPSELQDWAREADLDLLELTGLHYNPLTGNYWLGPGIEVNYLAYCRPAG